MRNRCICEIDFDEVKEKKFQFVHIDVDLYQPTLESLNFFLIELLMVVVLFVMIIL